MSSREEGSDKKQKGEGENKVIEVLIKRYQFVFEIRSLYRLLPVKNQELLSARMAYRLTEDFTQTKIAIVEKS